MKDKDIIKLFDSAADSFGSSDITPGEIKAAVDKELKLGTPKSANTEDTCEEAVSPVFVAAAKRRIGILPQIAAGIGAFSIAAAAIGIGLYAGRDGLAALNAAATDPQVSVLMTESGDITQYEANTEETPTEGSAKTLLTLVNGVQAEYCPEGIEFYNHFDSKDYIGFVDEKDGRLIYDGRAQIDITDSVSLEQCYIDYYYHIDTGLSEFVLIGGDPSTRDIGYAIIFKTDDEDAWGMFAVAWHHSVPVEGLTEGYSFPDEMNLDAAWLGNGITQIENEFECTVELSLDHCCFIKGVEGARW
ncbi:MAG: hypothetical protein NC203_10510 [Firmicutes bacterium]|nr:hypothetical protein [[Eubacterium] siraeum]MCM1488784.1 hypothetical protein [Bacillota bacterium]